MRRFFWLKLLCAALALLPLNLCAQATAKDVFKKAANSVFLVYLQDDKGEATALGTAFVVGPRLLVTNAHVVESGNPVLAVGPIRVPLTVKKRDSLNDLALLSVDVDLPTALPLSVGDVQTGEQVFAIGNPEGLEKTISEGIVSGRRKSEGKDLLQITSPISHGSSGGPVLNSSSQVVGVAVAFLGEGQNLNFAVPAEYVTNLLLNRQAEANTTIPVKDLLPTLRTAVSLRDADKYSAEDSSSYQAHSRSAITAMSEAVRGVNDTASLRELTCIGTNSFDLSDLGIQAARKANRVPTRETEALLAFALYDRSSNAALTAAFSKEGSSEREAAEADRKRFSVEAESVASAVLSRSPKGKPDLLALHVMGGIKADANDYKAVITDELPIVAANMNVCSVDLRMMAYRRLINAYENLKQLPEAEQWFRRYAEAYSPESYEWDKEGDRREGANDSAAAASAYEKAALGADYLAYDYCYAATDRFKNADSNSDLVLDDGRKCIAAAAKNSDKTSQHYYDTQLPIVYRVMAIVLNQRGVYQQALEDVKESLVLAPNDAHSLNVEAGVYENLKRYGECIAVAQAAIRESDGKYAFMHFRLGSCYFDTEDWARAEDSFRRAAQSDKSDPEAAFNTGLSLQRQGYSNDARNWFNEALKRNPSTDLRATIMRLLN